MRRSHISRQRYAEQTRRHESLGQLLRAARTRAGFTQQQAGEELGYPQSWVSKIECGQLYVIDAFQLAELADLYGAGITELIVESRKRAAKGA